MSKCYRTTNPPGVFTSFSGRFRPVRAVIIVAQSVMDGIIGMSFSPVNGAKRRTYITCLPGVKSNRLPCFDEFWGHNQLLPSSGSSFFGFLPWPFGPACRRHGLPAEGTAAFL
jgi:hypothetical protein